MKGIFIISLVCAFLISGCARRNPSNQISDADDLSFGTKKQYILNFEEELSKKQPLEFALNNLVRKVTFVPLETSESSPFFTEYNLLVHSTGSQFIISSGIMDKILPALLYDSSGHFITSLVRRGRGPSEIVGAVPVSHLNDSLKTLSVFGGRKIVSYSYVKNKLGNTLLEQYISSGVLLNDGNYIVLPSAYHFNEEDPYLCFLNAKGETLKSLTYPAGTNKAYRLKEGESNGPNEKYILSSNYLGDALFHDIFNDTLYRIDHLNHIEPYILLNRGNLLPNHKNVYNSGKRNETIHIHRIAETKDYFFISYNYLRKYYISIWSKDTEKLLANISDSPSIHPFSAKYKTENDVEVWVGIVGFAEDKLYGIMNASDASTFISEITENDNPVLLIMDL
ncbi:MAG TPA: hypothetical protein DEQ30_13380 [Porphyromonadaceae bacterium]|nr:hypothetical protein [Porphyromonadaceae bacterium]